MYSNLCLRGGYGTDGPSGGDLQFHQNIHQRARIPPLGEGDRGTVSYLSPGGFDHLKALERKGYLKRTGSMSRGLEVLVFQGSEALGFTPEGGRIRGTFEKREKAADSGRFLSWAGLLQGNLS